MPPAGAPFGDRLAGLVGRRESQIVLGLDPDPANLWPQAAGDVAAHCRAVIDAAAEACVAVKPQVACFERLGAPGWARQARNRACTRWAPSSAPRRPSTSPAHAS